MTKKILHSILLVALVVLLAGYTIIMGSVYQYFSSLQKTQLKAQLNLVAQAVENEGENYLKDVPDNIYRLTLIAEDGTVIFDSKASADSMENHSDRKEIKDALESGYGESSRFSSTLTEKTIYLAKKLSNSTVLRISATHVSAFTLIMGMLQPLLVVLVVAIVLSIALASRLSKNIVEPLNKLSLDNPLDNNVYEELTPLLKHIANQNKQIAKQMSELQRKQLEFEAITENMSEGLVLLGKDNTVISINYAAKKLFAAYDDHIGKDFLTIERSREINKLIEDAAEKGETEETIERNGRSYLFRLSRITSKGQTAGLVMLIIDVTEKTQAEKGRREFTANVSHELKTPLQSILGSAELLENNMVKPEDVPRFIGHIKSEAARLVTLINDIIQISRIDESGNIEKEDVKLYDVADEVTGLLSQTAAKRGIILSLEGDDITVSGSRQLIYEVIYNLCDNAIKYNKENGSVKISVFKNQNGKGCVSVADTGIGIAPEEQERIFERFYRVDKSHSKETGGTGLGLAIVKHAMQNMGGKIALESVLGKGTVITVSFS